MHLDFDPNSLASEQVSFDQFLKVDIRLGEVVQVDDFPEARNPSYKLKIDFGPGAGVKKSSAQITHHYKKEDLMGKKVLAVVNFPPRQIATFMSEVLVLGVSDLEGHVTLPDVDSSLPNGSRLY